MKVLTKLEENVLLTILKMNNDAYIKTIKEFLETNSKKRLSFGALYVLLNRLISDGYLSTEIGESTGERGGKAKKYYKLTAEGVKVLKESLKFQQFMWEDFNDLVKNISDI